MNLSVVIDWKKGIFHISLKKEIYVSKTYLNNLFAHLISKFQFKSKITIILK